MSGEADPVAVRTDDAVILSLSGYDADSFGRRFLQDADTATVHQAWHRVISQAVEAFTTPTSSAGWEGIDSTYIICDQDRNTSPALQRVHAERATRFVELPTGHHPFITRPDLVVNQLQKIINH